jgi:hypothetical protein
MAFWQWVKNKGDETERLQASSGGRIGNTISIPIAVRTICPPIAAILR